MQLILDAQLLDSLIEIACAGEEGLDVRDLPGAHVERLVSHGLVELSSHDDGLSYACFDAAAFSLMGAGSGWWPGVL